MNFVSCNTYNREDDPSGFTVVASTGDLVLIGLINPGVSGFDHFHGFAGAGFADQAVAGNTSGVYSYVITKTLTGGEDLVFPWTDLPTVSQVVVLVYSPDSGYSLHADLQTRGTGSDTVYNGATTATVSLDCSDFATEYFPWGTNDKVHFAWVGGFSGIVSGPDPRTNSWSTSSSESSTDRCGQIFDPSGFGGEYTLAAWDAFNIDSGPSAFTGTVDGTIDIDETNTSTTGGFRLWAIATRIVEICTPDAISTDDLTINCSPGQVCWVWPGPGCTASAIHIRIYHDGVFVTGSTYSNISVEDGGPLLCDSGIFSASTGEWCVTGAYLDHFGDEGAESGTSCCTVTPPPPEGGNHWGMLVSPVHG